jgi:spectinomycin phosphotransferase
VQTRPDSLTDDVLSEALRAGWALHPATLNYLPVGFGSHHWRVDAGGSTWFVTVDDLTTRLHSGAASLDDAHDALRAALVTALAVSESGLTFAVAPRRTVDGNVLQRVGAHYCVAVYPWVEGRRRGFGEELNAGERAAVLDLLVQLHATPPEIRAHARADDFRIVSRAELEAALDDLCTPWDTGPYAERARLLLGEFAASVDSLLRSYDAIATRDAADMDRMVLTHGEPHTGNLLEADSGWLLVDWDTALVAPPERDLWLHVDADPAVTHAYEQSTQRRVRPEFLTLYRLRWLATDLALFVSGFTHEDTDDIRTSWAALQAYLRRASDV